MRTAGNQQGQGTERQYGGEYFHCSGPAIGLAETAPGRFPAGTRGPQRSGCSFGQIRSAIFFDPLSAGWIPSKMMSRSLITQRGSTKVQFSTEFSQARARVALP